MSSSAFIDLLVGACIQEAEASCALHWRPAKSDA